MPPRQQGHVGRKRRHEGTARIQSPRCSSTTRHNATTSDVSLLPFVRYLVKSGSSSSKQAPQCQRGAGRGRGSATNSRGRGDFSAFTADLPSTSETSSCGFDSSGDESDSCGEPLQPQHTNGFEELPSSLEERKSGDADESLTKPDQCEQDNEPTPERQPRKKRVLNKRLRSTDSFIDEGLDTDPPPYVRSTTHEWHEEPSGDLVYTKTTRVGRGWEKGGWEGDGDDGDISEISDLMERCMSISSSDERVASTSSTSSSRGRVVRGVTLSSPMHGPVLTSSTNRTNHESTANASGTISDLDTSFVTEFNLSTPRSHITVTRRRSNSQGRHTPLTPNICSRRRPASSPSTPHHAPSPSSFFLNHASLRIDIASTLLPSVVGRTKRAREDSTRRAHVQVPKQLEKETVRRLRADRATKHLIRSLRPRDDFTLHVVLDLDETLVYARSGTILVRPYASYLINLLSRCCCEVILWTAGIPEYVEGIIEALKMACDVSPTSSPLMGPRRPWYHHLITRTSKWFDEDGCGVKDLRRLGRRMDRTLIVENNPASVQLQTENAILVQDYVVEDYQDISLKIAADLIERCVEAVRQPGSTQTPIKVLQESPELMNVTFSLAAEHCASKEPTKVTARGLVYVPPKSRKGPRCYAGEAPI